MGLRLTSGIGCLNDWLNFLKDGVAIQLQVGSHIMLLAVIVYDTI
jgi:hypothetical protein